tara:strand:+ start:17874 stop:18134 length:261 start_codon:yes stop_codon:yes gene_type:complete
MDDKTWTHIHFDMDEVDIDYLFELKKTLRDEGVTFDTGTDLMANTHEWHTDWSLEGRMDVADLAAFLDVRKVKYTLVKQLKHEDEE